METLNTDLVVGGPVCDRAWIIPKWFEHTSAACRHAGLSPEYVFAVPSWDRSSTEEIISCSSALGRPATIITVKEPQRRDQRIWNENRYQHMVDLRNLVLAEVRDIAPEYFLSLDSDILVRFDAISKTLEHMDRFDAVGMRTWMTPHGKEFPSYGMLKNGRLYNRRDMDEGCFPVEVIMAAKLMSPAAYHVDYATALDGEDIGWSMACTTAGLKLGWNAEALAKHVMAPELLDRVDQRLGW